MQQTLDKVIMPHKIIATHTEKQHYKPFMPNNTVPSGPTTTVSTHLKRTVMQAQVRLQ